MSIRLMTKAGMAAAVLAALPLGCGGAVEDRNDRHGGGSSASGGGTGGDGGGGAGGGSVTGGSGGVGLEIPPDGGPGCAGVSSSSRTLDEVEAAIQDELEALNYCNTVDECGGQRPPYDCRSQWINSGANRERLDALLEEYGEVDCDGPLTCPLICLCGTLRCIEGRCVAESDDCMEPTLDGVSVCM